MSDFVADCRQEWRRLGVSAHLAEEMASDLASDLEEAEAEGVSIEQLLGASASDAAAFAASWAAERGIIPATSDSTNGHRRSFVLIAFTAVAMIAVIFAALALLTGQPEVSIAATGTKGTHLPDATSGSPLPPGHARLVLLHASTAAPVEWILLFLAIVALAFAAWVWTRRSHRPPAIPASS